MPAAALAVALAVAPLDARGAGFGLERVDVLAEDPGFFLNYELPTATTYAARPALRFVEQAKLVWSTPWRGLTIGTSLASQSLVYEHPLWLRGLSWTAGVQAQTLLPRGLLGGLAYRVGFVRVAVGVSLVSGASWSMLSGYGFWMVMPTLGLGIVRPPREE